MTKAATISLVNVCQQPTLLSLKELELYGSHRDKILHVGNKRMFFVWRSHNFSFIYVELLFCLTAQL